jgi:hypothetical protein
MAASGLSSASLAISLVQVAAAPAGPAANISAIVDPAASAKEAAERGGAEPVARLAEALADVPAEVLVALALAEAWGSAALLVARWRSAAVALLVDFREDFVVEAVALRSAVARCRELAAIGLLYWHGLTHQQRDVLHPLRSYFVARFFDVKPRLSAFSRLFF